jgi:hypothetical protein
MLACFALAGLVGCGGESAPEVSQPAQPTVLAQYDGVIVYTVGEGTYSTGPQSTHRVVKVIDSSGELVLLFGTPVTPGAEAAWKMTDLPPQRVALSPLSTATTGDRCLRTTWSGHGSGEFTLTRAQFDISAAVHQDTCEEGPIDAQYSFSFEGTAVR